MLLRRLRPLQEAGQLVADVASAMVHVGMQPHARASVFGSNCPEWMLTMQAGRGCVGGGLEVIDAALEGASRGAYTPLPLM